MFLPKEIEHIIYKYYHYFMFKEVLYEYKLLEHIWFKEYERFYKFQLYHGVNNHKITNVLTIRDICQYKIDLRKFRSGVD